MNPRSRLAYAPAVLALAAWSAWATTLRASDAAVAVDFREQIAPLLAKYCVGCHGGTEPEAKLSLEMPAGIRAGGKQGPVLVPGKSGDSRLIQVLTGGEPKMPPPDNDAPTADEISLLVKWVDQGAAMPPADEAPPPLVTPAVPLRAPARQPVTAVAFGGDGKLLAAAGPGMVRLLAADDRALLGQLAPHSGQVTDLAFTRDGSRLFAAAGEPGLAGELQVWDVAGRSPVQTIRGHRDSLYAVAISSDGATIATAGYDQQIILWDFPSGQPRRTITGHSGAIFDLDFSPDGRWLASASADRTLKLWDVNSGQRMDTFGQPLKEQFTVAFSPDGKRLAAGGADNRIRIWEISPTAQEGTNPIRLSKFVHQGTVLKLVYAPDSKFLASAADDRTVKLHSADDVQSKWTAEAQSDWPAALAFSPDGKRLAVGRLDGSLDVYDAASGKPAPLPKPELATVTPRGVQRGVTTRLRLTGSHLVGAVTAAGADPVLQAGAVQVADSGGEALLEVNPPADAPRGAYKLAVTGPGGVSGKLDLWLDDLPQSVEAEPNNLRADATVISLPAAVWGAAEAKGDVDHFAFDAQAGQTMVIDLAAQAAGQALASKLNGMLALYDPQGRVVAANNDNLNELDSLLVHTITVAGRYTVAVSDQSLAGSADHRYRLTVGALPVVVGTFPLGVPAKTSTEVQLVGYNLPADLRVAVQAGESGEAEVPLDGERYRVRGGAKVVVGAFSETLESEPNDAPGAAGALAPPMTVNGRIQSPGDADYFRFEAKAGQTWVIETEAARRGSPVDTRLDVLDHEGRPVERMVLEAVRDSSVTFRPINSTATDVRVTNWEEMELNQFLYLQGEVTRLFRLPQGPDSGFLLFAWNGQRVSYFDTSPATHALDEACYIVEPRPAGSAVANTGLPVFRLNYANDDDGQRKLGRDSRLTFTAPADSAYLIRVQDVRGLGGERSAYRLTVRPPRPDFHVSVSGNNAAVFTGGGRGLTFTANRVDGFDGPIRIDLAGLPPGFHASTPVEIEAGHTQAFAVIFADADATAPENASDDAVKATATAVVDGTPVSKDLGKFGAVRLAPKGKITVRLSPDNVEIAPGQTVTAQLRVERNGNDGPINFTMNNLPHGVYVDNIGLNGVLIPEKQNEREIFLTARPWVSETSRTFYAASTVGGGEASPPITLHVRKPGNLAQAAAGQGQGN